MRTLESKVSTGSTAMKSNQRREKLESDIDERLTEVKRKLITCVQLKDSVRRVDNKLNSNRSRPYQQVVKGATAIMMGDNKNTSNHNNTCNYAANQFCAILTNNKSNKSSSPLLSAAQHETGGSQDKSSSTQNNMYNISKVCMKLYSKNQRFTSSNNVFLARRQRQATTSSTKILYDKLFRRTALQALVIVASLLLVSSCTFIVPTQAASSEQDVPQASTSAQALDNKLSASERSDSATGSASAAAPSSSSSSSSSSSNQSQASSIVASLSSAVASAAAAAAVAAAQSSLSGGDARSLLSSSSSSSAASGSQHHQPAHQSRSPGLHLAFKLADAIPEVPYSILHNMKKLDHAAPFYNVGNKVIGGGAGAVKESSHSLLSSALSGSGGIGGAADQLSSLFRSPLWKRLADGYGEFTSEFRSLFRAPPTPMKGPLSPTTKLLRDISVPAFLMLIASAMPSEWRPIVKTRRKSLLPVSSEQQSQTIDPMTMAAAEQVPNFSNQQQLFRQNFNLLPFQSQPQQQLARGLISPSNGVEQFGSDSNRLARAGEPNNMSPPNANSFQWMQSAISPGQPSFEQSQMDNLQPALQPVSIRRLGDANGPFVGPESSGNGQTAHEDHSKPVKNDHQRSQSSATSSSSSFSSSPTSSAASSSSSPSSNQQQPSLGLFGSLTSGLANAAQSKLMNRLMNVNGGSISGGSNNQNQLDSYRMLNLADEQRMSLLRATAKDQLSDKHRYSLLADEDNSDSLAQSGNSNEKLTPQPKPLLSAMSQAVNAVFNSAAATAPLRSGSLSLATASIDDKTLLRRQQTGGTVPEQRDLTQLLPQSWKEVVKRTVNNVKEEATTQWRSIEGQLTNWVQDKLKTLPLTPASGTSTASASAPVSNIFATVGSTALNILGIGNKNASSSQAPSSSSDSASSSSSSKPENGLRNKNDAKASNQPSAKSALAGVANLIVNTLTRPATSASAPKPKQGDDSSSTLISQYTTHTGAQPSSQQSTSSASMAAGSTAAAVAQSIAA